MTGVAPETPVRGVAIRWLAETLHRRGDLYPYRGGETLRVPTRAEEGIATQRRIQRERPDGYRAEYAVRHRVEMAGVEYELRGRVDGLLLDTDSAVLEEFKTTRADPETVHRHDGAVHWAQARLYAALLTIAHSDIRRWCLRLLYCHPDTSAVRTYEQQATPAELDQFLQETLQRLRPNAQVRHEQERDAWLNRLPFPFARFRPHQRAMARRVYRALAKQEPLLIEAPTGSGKTMAVLYPALKSLTTQTAEKLLFLTSRGTGAEAAQAALAKVDPGGKRLRHLTITAKEKACFVPGMPCAADRCRYAKGYYDKRGAALRVLLDRRAIDPDTIATVAREHEVCPFELSLDAAVRADVVICDYNYVFDPVVRLRRFMAEDGIELLIDEAHQLYDRALDMLSTVLSRHTFKAALGELAGEGKRVRQDIAKRLKSIDRALLALRREHGKDVEDVIDQPIALNRAVKRFLDEVATLELDLTQRPLLRTALFDAARWLRSEGWREAGAFEYFLDTRRGAIAVRSQCLDASDHLRETLTRFGGHVRFSGTLSPLPLYNQLHGLPDAPRERTASAFDERQLAVLLVRDINTYLRGRDASMSRLVEAVHAVFAARAGHYLVAFPSYAYLEQFTEAARPRFPHGALHCQTPSMTDAQRGAFLDTLRDAKQPRLAAVVLGGIFAESVDLAEVPLAGVIAVGVGLPPPDLTRNRQRRFFDLKSGNGQQVSFWLPAMTRIVQAAGRLLRSPEQRGVICLIDPRIGNAEYRAFFPAHWRPRTVAADCLSETVAKFWEASMLPPQQSDGDEPQVIE